MGNFSNHDSDLMICNNDEKFILRIELFCKYQQIHPTYWRQYFLINIDRAFWTCLIMIPIVI